MSNNTPSNNQENIGKTASMPDELHSRYRQLLDTKCEGKGKKVHRIPELANKLEEKYQIGERIARGGMGDVRSVKDVNCQRDVAMKVLHGLDRKAPKRVYRFIREAQITAQLEHPNIVPIYDLSTDPDGNVFYTMKKVQGTTLEEILDELKEKNPSVINTYPLSRLLTIFQGICHAVAYAHSKGVIHRDLKPNNIMIGKYGEVLVMDWGLAKVLGSTSILDTEQLLEDEVDIQSKLTHGTINEKTHTSYKTRLGECMGTLGYMSPEQGEGRVNEINQLSDIFSLGVILYKILTLLHPTIGRRPSDLIDMLRKGEIPAPEKFYEKLANDKKLLARDIIITPPVHCPYQKVPSSLSAVTMKAIAFKPIDRYHTVTELQEEISRYQSGHATFAEDAGLTRVITLLIKRHKLFTSGVFVILLLTTGFILRIIQSERRSRHLAEEADKQRSLAIKNERIANKANVQTQLQYANGLISQGNSYALLQQWHTAKSAFWEGFQLFKTLNKSTFLPEYKLWETTRYLPPIVKRISEPHRQPLCMDFSDDGRLCISGYYDGTLILNDLLKAVEKRIFLDTQNKTIISAVNLAHKAPKILAGRYDGKIDLWNLNTGNKIYSLRGHRQMINQIIFSPDDRLALSGSEDGTMLLWDLEAGRKLSEFSGHPGGVKSIAFSHDGEALLSGGVDNLVVLWDRQSHQKIKVLKGHKHEVRTVNFSLDDKTILSGDYDGVIKIWERSGGNVIKTFKHHRSPIIAGNFLADDNSFVIGQEDSTISLWDIKHEFPNNIFKGNQEGAIDLKFSSTGTCLLLGNSTKSLGIQPIEQREVVSFFGHKGPIEHVDFSPDGYLAISTGWDKRIMVWDIATGNRLFTYSGHKSTVTQAMFLPKDYTVLSASHDGMLKMWNILSRKEIASLKSEHGPIEDLDVADSGDFALVGYRSNRVVKWNLNTKKIHSIIDTLDSPVTCIDISPNGQLALIGHANGQLILKDLYMGKAIKEFTIKKLSSAVFSPKNNSILCGHRDGILTIIDNNLHYNQRRVKAHADEIYDLDYTANGRYMVSASRDTSIKLWDAESLLSFATLNDHKGAVTSIRFSPDGKKVLSGSRDNSLKLWDFSRFLQYKEFESRVNDAHKALNKNPNDPKSLAILGEWYAFRGMWNWAIELLNQAKEYGQEVSALTLARCHWKTQCPESAYEEFQRARMSNESPNQYLQLCLNALRSHR